VGLVPFAVFALFHAALYLKTRPSQSTSMLTQVLSYQTTALDYVSRIEVLLLPVYILRLVTFTGSLGITLGYFMFIRSKYYTSALFRKNVVVVDQQVSGLIKDYPTLMRVYQRLRVLAVQSVQYNKTKM
jgi:hypothetical protein